MKTISSRGPPSRPASSSPAPEAGAATAAAPAATPSCMPYTVPESTDLMTPTVTFSANVMGQVLLNNCGTSSCHGVKPGMGGLFLGVAASDAATVYAEIVGKNSSELPSMPFVTAGDPEKSYLMHKMDGDQCQFDAECVAPSCLALMPNGANMPLPVTYRDIVRRWIAQGAMNN